MNRGSGSGRRILLIEDDAVVRGAMKLVLEWEGYQVACAANGQEALELLRSDDPPSLILLDVMMPVLDGWQFRKEQQRDPVLADIPVVVVSALDAGTSPEADEHIQKPFQVHDLLEAIRRRITPGGPRKGLA